MGTSNEKEQKPKSTNPPEQKLGDTPVPPWEMPTPEEKEQAKPIRRALKDAVAKVDSPEKADEVMEKLENSVADQTLKDVEQSQPPPASPASAAGRSAGRRGGGVRTVRRRRARLLEGSDNNGPAVGQRRRRPAEVIRVRRPHRRAGPLPHAAQLRLPGPRRDQAAPPAPSRPRSNRTSMTRFSGVSSRCSVSRLRATRWTKKDAKRSCGCRAPAGWCGCPRPCRRGRGSAWRSR